MKDYPKPSPIVVSADDHKRAHDTLNDYLLLDPGLDLPNAAIYPQEIYEHPVLVATGPLIGLIRFYLGALPEASTTTDIIRFRRRKTVIYGTTIWGWERFE